MKYKPTIIAPAIAVISILTAHSGHTAPPPSDERQFSALASYAQHLLDTHQYGDAINAAERMVAFNPSVALGYQYRGTAGFEVGAVRQAASDFRMSSQLSKSPVGHVGLSMCDLFSGDIENAANELTLASRLKPEFLSDTPIQMLSAVLQYRKGNSAIARQIAATMSDPSGKALVCFLDAEDGKLTAVDEFTNASSLYDQMQTTIEVPQNRIVLTAKSVRIDPAEPSADLRKLYTARLSELIHAETNTLGADKRVVGIKSIAPPSNVAVPRTGMVRYLVDQDVTAIMNAPPYSYQWDTSKWRNGPHEVKVAVLDSAGTPIAEKTRRFYVNNVTSDTADENIGGMTVDELAKAQSDLWSHLSPRIARQSFEFSWGRLCALKGDEQGAIRHRLQASAMSIESASSRQYIHKLLLQTAGSQNSPDVWQGRTSRREIALTFDDGPDPINLPKMLSALGRAHLPATFFVVGSRSAARSDLIRDIAARGDEVENHSYTHPNLAMCSPLIVDSELAQTSVLIHDITGRFPTFFRPPGGNASKTVLDQARYFGMTGGFWTLDAFNFEQKGDSKVLANYVLSHIHPGTVVLMHNGSRTSINAMPEIAAGLQARGYKCVLLKNIGVSPISDRERRRLKE